MNIQRIQEIINSSSLININYRGIPVFVQQVHVESETATVFPLDEMNHDQVVELSGLTEEGPDTTNGGISMDKQRAEEIAQAPDMKDVTYNGEQIYIQYVNEQNDTARVFPLADPENEFEIQIDHLHENE